MNRKNDFSDHHFIRMPIGRIFLVVGVVLWVGIVSGCEEDEDKINGNGTPLSTIADVKPDDVLNQIDAGEEFQFPQTGVLIPPKLTRDCARSGEGGLELTHDPQNNDFTGWGVHWLNATDHHFDASGFKSLNFAVKGAEGGEIFEIKLKDTSGREEVTLQSSDLNMDATSGWIERSIPLASFTGVDTSILEQVGFALSTTGASQICIDEIEFAP